MIVYVDGPEKAGKTTLLKEFMKLFDNKRDFVTSVKHTGRAKEDGYEYLRPFIFGLDRPQIQAWDRGWVSEVIYGQLLGQARLFSSNPFLAEWVYSRLMNGRGGRFILLPYNEDRNAELRDETDLDVDPYKEIRLFREYALTWGYTVLYNKYNRKSKKENAQKLFTESLVSGHTISSPNYVGPSNPVVTFIGDTNQDFAFVPRPFFDTKSAQFFKPFGPVAITHFGYMSTAYAATLDDDNPLMRHPITVGRRANHMLPNLRTVPDMGPTTPENIVDFISAVTEQSKTLITDSVLI